MALFTEQKVYGSALPVLSYLATKTLVKKELGARNWHDERKAASGANERNLSDSDQSTDDHIQTFPSTKEKL